MAADPITKTTVDDLMTLDFDDDSVFGDNLQVTNRDDKTTLSPRPAKRKTADDDKESLGLGLGLDEEVKITKKRKPIAKLDEARLMSQPGLPKLHALARSGNFANKLRLKGKGHEFTDAARLLTYYQLWLDDLYPRAKFADALQLAEKSGHSKTLQRQRKEWIDEGKPGYIRERERRKEMAEAEARRADDAMMSGGLQDGHVTDAGSPRAVGADERPRGQEDFNSVFGNGAYRPDDDLFVPDQDAPNMQYDEPDDDELDALLADHGQTHMPTPRQQAESDSEDDLDAFLAEQSARRAPASAKKPAPVNGMFEDDEDELDALLSEHDTAGRDSKATAPSTSEEPAATHMTASLASTQSNASSKDVGTLPGPFEAQETSTEHAEPDDYSDFEPADLETFPISPAKPLESTTNQDSQGRIPLSSPIRNASPSPIQDQPSPSANPTEIPLDDSELPAVSPQLTDTAPELPKPPRTTPLTPTKDESQGRENGVIFSSSPIPNDMMGLDDLDALMDQQGK